VAKRVTCRFCGSDLPLSVLTKGAKCPGCGRGVLTNSKPNGGRRRAGKRSRAGPLFRIPSDRRVQGRIYWPKHATEGWRVEIRGQGTWRFRLDGDGYLPAELANAWWYYQVVRVASTGILIRPERPVRGQPFRFRIDPKRFAKSRNFPKPCGMSPWELESSDRTTVVARIEKLAKKNDPFSWRELICGYRRMAIRLPIERALRDIGVHRALWLIRSVPGDWGDEVIQFLEAEMKKQKRETLPSAPPDWDWTQRPYWDD
jgi:hypothetical protein